MNDVNGSVVMGALCIFKEEKVERIILQKEGIVFIIPSIEIIVCKEIDPITKPH